MATTAIAIRMGENHRIFHLHLVAPHLDVVDPLCDLAFAKRPVAVWRITQGATGLVTAMRAAILMIRAGKSQCEPLGITGCGHGSAVVEVSEGIVGWSVVPDPSIR